MAQGLVRPITRKQALSYDRTVPNGSGVTALSEINGRGAYARAYAHAARVLQAARKRTRISRAGDPHMKKKHRRRRVGSLRSNVRRRRGYRPNLTAWSPSRGTYEVGSSSGADVFVPGHGVMTASQYASLLARGGRKASKKKGRKAGKRGASRSGKLPSFAAAMRRKHPGASAKQIATWWKMAKRSKTKRYRKNPWYPQSAYPQSASRGVTYSGGSAEVWSPEPGTSRRRGKKKARRPALPRTLVRYGSAHKTRRRRTPRVYHTTSVKIGKRTRRTYVTRSGRKAPVYAMLGFRSAKALQNALKSTSRYTDKQRAKLESQLAKILARRRTAAERAAKRILQGRDPFVANTRSRKMRRTKKKGRKARRRSTHSRRVVRKRRHVTRRTYRSNVRRKSSRRRKSTRRPTLRRRVRRANAFISAVNRSFRSKKKGKARRRLPSLLKRHLFSNPRRHTRRRRSRRGFIRNFGGAYLTTMKNVLKVGAFAGGGFIAHRVGSNLLNTYVFPNIGFLADPASSLSPYRKVIASATVLAIGVPLATKMLGLSGSTVAVGMVVSAGLDLILALAGRLDSSGKVASALSAYPDAGGYASNLGGMGSYYTFRTHQQYPANLQSGVGEYLETGNTGLMQQAAGFGNMQLLQAAAGMGEYEVVPGYSGMGMTDEGVAPNLFAAEQALNVAEAAAGVGDLSMVSISDPAQQVIAVPDEPGGSRAAVFAGPNGIFG